MPKKYVRCRVLHPGKKEFVSADIEIDVTEEVVRIDNPRLTFDATVAPVHNDLIAAGIDSTWPSKIKLYNTHRQSDYVGTVDEVIHRIVNESC